MNRTQIILSWVGGVIVALILAVALFTAGRGTAPTEKGAEKPPAGKPAVPTLEQKIAALEQKLAEAQKAPPATKATPQPPDTCTSVTMVNGQRVTFLGVPPGECVTKNMLSPRAQCPSGRAILEPRGKAASGDNHWHVRCLA